MSRLHEDPIVELVRQAMACAVVNFLENPGGFKEALAGVDQSTPIHHHFTKIAEDFVKVRTDLTNMLDHHWQLMVDEDGVVQGGVTGELEDYLEIRDGENAEKAFNLFIKRWVPKMWHAHLMDNDDNEAQFVRDSIERNLQRAAEGGVL